MACTQARDARVVQLIFLTLYFKIILHVRHLIFK